MAMKVKMVWSQILTLVFASSAVAYTMLSGRYPRQTEHSMTRTDIMERIKEWDDMLVPPKFDSDEPLLIESDLYVSSFDSVSEANMDFTLGVHLHLHWIDERLRKKIGDVTTEYVDVDSFNMANFWFPDIYFPNEKKSSFHNVIVPNKVLRLYKNQSVTYTSRLSLTLSCPMDLRSYPFDKQTCAVKLESFGYTEDQIILKWSNSSEPVELKKGTELPQFRVIGSRFNNSQRFSKKVKGNYSTLIAEFLMVRNINYYVIQMYIPSLLIVMLSWVSFWLNVNSVPGRVSLGVLSVLTISTQSSSVNASLPRVSYTKAIDIWMATCLVFVVAALIEFAVANVVSRKGSGKGMLLKRIFKIPKFSDESKEGPLEKTLSRSTLDVEGVTKRQRDMGFKDTTINMHGSIKLSQNSFQTIPDDDVAKKSSVNNGVMYALYLDVASRILFPFVFGIFNLVYWVYYLNIMDF